VDGSRYQQPRVESERRVQIAGSVGRSGKDNGAGSWASESLDSVVDVVDQGSVVGEGLDQNEHCERDECGWVRDRIPGLVQEDEIGVLA